MAISKLLKEKLKDLKTRLKDLGFNKETVNAYTDKNITYLKDGLSFQIDNINNVINDETIKKDLDKIAEAAKNTIKNRKKGPLDENDITNRIYSQYPESDDNLSAKGTGLPTDELRKKLYQKMKGDILDNNIAEFVTAAKTYKNELKKDAKKMANQTDGKFRFETTTPNQKPKPTSKKGRIVPEAFRKKEKTKKTVKTSTRKIVHKIK